MPEDIKKLTEQEMRDHKVPWFEDPKDLAKYISDLVEREHDYGTSAYAMSLAATAAFQYVAKKLGTTSFQAGCADMDALRRMRDINGPFMIVQAENMLYPQYDIIQQLKDSMDGEWKEWASKEAWERICESDGKYIAPSVLARWRELAKPETVEPAIRKIDLDDKPKKQKIKISKPAIRHLEID